MANGNAPKPGTRKVTIGALSGAVVTIVGYFLTQNGVSLTSEVTAAAGTVVTAILFYVTTETYT